VKLYYSYAIFATYMVQFYVPMDFLEPPLYNHLLFRFPRHHAKLQLLIQIVFRTVMVAVTGELKLSVHGKDFWTGLLHIHLPGMS